MDISKVHELVAQDDEGVVVTIYQRNGDPYLAADGSEATMTVLGSESKAYRAAERRQQRRLFKRMRVRSADVTPEETEAEAIELASSAVIGWHGWESNGKPLDCKPEHVKALLGVKHIFEQVNAAIQGHASLFGARSGD